MIRVSGMSKIIETLFRNEQPLDWCVVYDSYDKSVRLESCYGTIAVKGEYVVGYEDEDPNIDELKKFIESIEGDEIEFVKGF